MPNQITLGQKAADKITQLVGSWTFIIIQVLLMILWLTANIIAWISHWDPYPFILLNLALSFQAAFTAPIILMSGNRELDRERKRNEADLATDRKAEREIQQIQIKLEALEKEKIDKILEILNSKK